MKKLGIIGGMGPMATQLLYKMIIENTDASFDQEHIDMIILNHASMPDRTKAILSGNTQKVFKLLSDDAVMLERCGAQAIVIPCNTSHFFCDSLQEKVKIPIINMIRETAEAIKGNSVQAKRIGVLATDGTLHAGIYKTELEKLGMEYVAPTPEIQSLVMKIIYEQVKKGEEGNMKDFVKIENFMKKEKCDKVIMACTELSCFMDFHNLGDYYTDALKILTLRAIEFCGGKIKKR